MSRYRRKPFCRCSSLMKNDISVYVHLPFCIKKCNYCDFLSGSYSDLIKKSYIDCLLNEIDLYSDLLSKREIRTVYLGGGTPTVLPASYIVSIIEKLKKITSFKEGCEITIEMNPGTADEEKTAAYLQCGINRFSIGLQSVNDNELKALGRIHSYDDFLHLYDLLGRRGASNINIDLMTGIPYETVHSAERSLKEICALSPKHISVYSLILEEGTPFWHTPRKDLRLPDEDTEYEIYEMTRAILKENGYERYEISNYARSGFECIHNTVYWEIRDYIGFGAGAASRIGNRRYTNIRNVEGYIRSEPFTFDEDLLLDDGDMMSEFVFMGLRKTAGIDVVDFSNRFGKEILDVYGDIIRKHEEKGLLILSDKRLRFSEKGMDISNVVLKDFV